MTRNPAGGTRGFTLFEMLVTISIIAMLAVMVAPAIHGDTRLRLTSASAIVASDIEMAQVMSISNPGSPVVVRFDATSATYWLACANTPDAPITRADTGEPYRVHLGQGRASSAAGVTLETVNLDDDMIAFDPHGGVTNFLADPAIVLRLGGEAITLKLATTTGTITEIEGAATSGPGPGPGGTELGTIGKGGGNPPQKLK